MRHWGWTSRRSLIQLHGATSCGSVVSPKQMRHVPASYLVADELVADELAGWVAAATQLLHRRASFLLRCALLNAEPHFAQFSISTSQELFKSSLSHASSSQSRFYKPVPFLDAWAADTIQLYRVQYDTQFTCLLYTRNIRLYVAGWRCSCRCAESSGVSVSAYNAMRRNNLRRMKAEEAEAGPTGHAPSRETTSYTRLIHTHALHVR